MLVKQFINIISICGVVFATANAEGLTAVRPLKGYKCMSLTLTREQLWDYSALPPVFAAPTEGSQQLGVSPGIAIVASPLNEANGFVEIIRLNGQRGWMAAEFLKPYRNLNGSPGTCIPSIMSDNSIGFKFSAEKAGNK